MIYAFSIPNARRNRRNGTTFEGDTPYWYAVLRGGRRYAVRKGLVRSTHKFCYIVRRHQFVTLKRSNFHQETQHT